MATASNTVIANGGLGGNATKAAVKQSFVDPREVTRDSHPEPDEGSNGIVVRDERLLNCDNIPLDPSCVWVTKARLFTEYDEAMNLLG